MLARLYARDVGHPHGEGVLQVQVLGLVRGLLRHRQLHPDHEREPVRQGDLQALCVVPNAKGKKLRAAKRAIRRAHCSVGKVRRAFSSTVKRGRVVSQRPKPGAKRAAGSNVKLKVSKGTKP